MICCKVTSVGRRITKPTLCLARQAGNDLRQWALGATQAERVAWLAALRAIVGRRCAKNKAGAALVSDFDLIWSTEDERKEAWETMKKNAK